MANDDEVRLTPRAMEMRRLVAEQRASGMTVAAFAARRGINATTIFHWRHRFRRDAEIGGRDPVLVPVRIIDDEGREDARDDDVEQSRPTPSVLVVELGNARRIKGKRSATGRSSPGSGWHG